jgi:hypothetical protein
MTDVRLTALNPEDSTVVPVACNSSGELLVDKGAQGPDLNVEGDLSVDGSATFAGNVDVGTWPKRLDLEPGRINVYTNVSNEPNLLLSKTDSSANAANFIECNNNADSRIVTIAGNGSAVFAGGVKVGEYNQPSTNPTRQAFQAYNNSSVYATYWAQNNSSDANAKVWLAYDSVDNVTSTIKSDGSASFAGDLVVGSRSKSWMLVEQGGLCHMVEQTRSVDADEYPKLRDVFNELDLIERSLSQVMEKLRLIPPAGWPVWDGSDETQ